VIAAAQAASAETSRATSLEPKQLLRFDFEPRTREQMDHLRPQARRSLKEAILRWLNEAL
jgi:hypothetical protein